MKAARKSKGGAAADALRRWIEAECQAIETQQTPEGSLVKGRPMPKSAMRQKQEALRDALAAAHLKGEALPGLMVEALYSAAGDVCNGRTPELFVPTSTGRPVHEGARLASQVAGQFIATGPDDERKQRIAEVAQLFDVNKKTARAWGTGASPMTVGADDWIKPDRWLRMWAGVYKRHRPQHAKGRRGK